MSYKKYNNSYENYNSQAVALGYRKGIDSAPKILAKGKGLIADQIISKAKEHDVPIKKDAELIKILSILEIDSMIPFEAFGAIAEIMSSIYKYNDKLKNKNNISK